MKSKITMLLLSLLIALVLWYYVISVVSPDSEITIRGVSVQSQGEKFLLEQSNLMVVTDMSELEVDLKLEGNRTDLIKLDSHNITITVDVSKIDRAGEHKVTYSISMPGDIPSNAIAVKTREPDLLTIKVENRVTKDVPLELNYDVQDLDGSGYIIRESGLECPETITVSGPESTVKLIHHAKVDLDLKDRKESFNNENIPYVLCDKSGNKVDGQLLTHEGTVNVTLPIQYSKLLPLNLKYKDGTGATASDAVATFYIDDKDGDYSNDQPITGIIVSGSKTNLEGKNALVLGTVDLATVWEDNHKQFYDLDELLKGEPINNESGVTDVYAVITFPNLKQKELKNIALDIERNLADGLRATGIGVQRIDVIVRGPAALVDKLTPSDLDAYVDLTDATAGTTNAFIIKVEFKSEEFKSLGLVASRKDITLMVIEKPSDLPEDDA